MQLFYSLGIKYVWYKSRRSRVYHQDEVLHIINSAGIVYHHCERYSFQLMIYAWRRWYAIAFAMDKKTTGLNLSFFGGGRWIRTTEGIASRFTVCPLWPLGNSPIFSCAGAGGRTRTPDLLITNQLLYRLSYTSILTGTALSFLRGSWALSYNSKRYTFCQ